MYKIIKLAQNSARNLIVRSHEPQLVLVSYRNLSVVPSLYDGKDPAPKFFSSQVQVLLKRLTRPDFDKVFRKRTNSGVSVLKTPRYKFLTDEELDAEIAKTYRKAKYLLQMPPAVKIQNHVNEVLSQDPALIGYDSATYLFTDISFGVTNAHRIIVQRDPDGTLRSCDNDLRKRLNQVYFPIHGRKIREPAMFADAEKLHNLLDRDEYEFVLDRACIQYEPDEPKYQEITSITCQHIDLKSKYQILRSTRHFGTLAFYLTWHQSIDNLMLELLQSSLVREGVLLIALRQEILGDIKDGKMAQDLVGQIFNTQIQLTKPETVTEDDVQLDSKCVDCIAKYIVSNSSMKSQHELALQGFRESYQEIVELSRGLKKAHGNA